jgi:hypothetical protein
LEDKTVKKLALTIAAAIALIAAIAPASAEKVTPRDAMQTRSVKHSVLDANAHMHHHGGWHHHHHHHHRM